MGFLRNADKRFQQQNLHEKELVPKLKSNSSPTVIPGLNLKFINSPEIADQVRNDEPEGELKMTERKNLTISKIAIYLIIFFSIWSIRELAVQPILLDPLNIIVSEIIGAIIKLLVWTLPALLLIKYFQDDMWISLKDMFTTKPKWFKGAPIMLVIIIAPLLQALLHGGGIAVRPDFVPIRLIGVVLFVGITEEIVFRGFLLNAFLKKMKMWQAVALDAVLFYLIHIPIWIYQGHDIAFFLSATISVTVLSVLFAYSFIKTKNILVPIALHMIWNLLAFTLYLG